MKEDSVVQLPRPGASIADDALLGVLREGARRMLTGIGPVEVCRPKVRDRGAAEGAPIRFTSAVLPAYLRRTRNVAELLPWLYLKGISTGQFDEALTALLGPDAPGLSATTIRRLVATWQDEHERWQGRDLSTRRYVYVPPRSPDRGSLGHGSAGLLAADGRTGSIFAPA